MAMDWAGWLSAVSFRFGPPEYVALIALLLALVIACAPGSLLKAAAMAAAGALLGTIWGTDANSGVVRELFGWHLPDEVPLPALIIVCGFLLPRAVHYASAPRGRLFTTPSRLAYEGITLFECLPALLLMRQPWLPPRWVVPLVAVWAAALGVYFGFTPDDLLPGLALFGIGLLLQRLSFPWPPALMGLVLSDFLQENLRRSLLLSRGDWSTFVTRPICAALLGLALIVLVLGASVRRRRRRHLRQRADPGPHSPDRGAEPV